MKWKRKKIEQMGSQIRLASLPDNEIARSVTKTLDLPVKAPVEPQAAVRLSEDERHARREKNRAAARKRSQRRARAHGRQ